MAGRTTTIHVADLPQVRAVVDQACAERDQAIASAVRLAFDLLDHAPDHEGAVAAINRWGGTRDE